MMEEENEDKKWTTPGMGSAPAPNMGHEDLQQR